MNYYSLLRSSLIILIVTFTSCVISNYDDPCRISGKVTDSAGKAISNVIISSISGTSKDSITSTLDGKYTLIFLKGGPIKLFFSKTGYTGKSSNQVILGGEKKVLDIKLNTLSEDAYFNVGLNKKTVLNTGGIFTVYISTNLSYDYESKAPWITCTKSSLGLTIKCDSNEINEERIAFIILRAEYNHTDTITIKQNAGPILRVLDYLGKNNTSFPQTKPFVTFSREISVFSATGSNVNLPFELSKDKKTVSFSNIKLNAFSTMPVQLTVKASDGVQLNFDLNLKLYINSTPFIGINGQKMYFTNDDKFIWILSFNGNQHLLTQFSASDFTRKAQISGSLNNVFYNPYNNCLYTISQRLFEDRYVYDVNLYEADSGNFKETFILDNSDGVRSLAFSNNGIGLMICGTVLYSIDSSNKHKIQLIDNSNVNDIAPYGIKVCNDNRTFILFSPRYGTEIYVFTMDSETKIFKKLFFMSDYINFYIYNLITNNYTKNILYFSPQINNISFQDTQTNNIVTKNLTEGVSNAAILASNKALPNVLTSDFRLILPNENSVTRYTIVQSISYMESSNNAKLVCITYGNNLYLFKSEIFTEFNDYIK